MRWVLFGLAWLAVALFLAWMFGSAAKLGGEHDERKRKPKLAIGDDDEPFTTLMEVTSIGPKEQWKCVQCGWIGDYGEVALKTFVHYLQPYCPECGWFLDTGP